MSSPTKKRIRPHNASDAYENAYLMNERYPAFRFDAYPCLWCDGWHVGRKKTGPINVTPSE